MGLFESREFNQNAMTELERQMRNIEAVKPETITDKSMETLSANIQFAETAHLIRSVQADNFRMRLQNVRNQAEHQRLVREEYGEATDGYENPHERSVRYATMDEVKTNIEAMKALTREKEYTSAENGDYSPSHPWDAPGMSVRDFI